MGNTATIQRHIGEEYKRVKEVTKKKYGDKIKDNYMVLDQVLQMQPFREHPVDIMHLGTLFVLDSDRDGRFTEAEFNKFAELFATKKTQGHDFQTHLQAFCTLRMWNEIGRGDGTSLSSAALLFAQSPPPLLTTTTSDGSVGVEGFVEWFGKLFGENSLEARHFGRNKEILFLEKETVKTLHKLLNIKLMYGYGLDDFFDLMQRVAEEKGLMKLEDKKFDDFVPLTVVKDFGREFICGFKRVMTEMGFEPGMRIDIAPTEKESA